MQRIGAVLAILFFCLSSVAGEITYGYTPENPMTWVNGKDQGNYFDPGSPDVSQDLVKMLKVGTLQIDGMTTNQDNGTTIMLVTSGSPISITGLFPGRQPTDIRLIAEYFPYNGQRTLIDLTHAGNSEIHLYPEYKKTSLTMTIWLVIANPVRMVPGTPYLVSNLADYRFELHEETAGGNSITGELINISNNPFTSGFMDPFTNTEGPTQPPALNASLALLSHPGRTVLGNDPAIQLPASLSELQSGVSLLYLRVSFDASNGNTGMTKNLLVEILHDKLHDAQNEHLYSYLLSLVPDTSTGSVVTDSTYEEDSSGLLTYTLKNSSAGDVDVKRLDFRLPDDSFATAPNGEYTSTVMVALSVY